MKKSMTPHLTDDNPYDDIVTKSEQFEAANRGANAELTKLGYHSEVSRYTNAISTRSSYATQQARLDKSQPLHNRLATPGARSTTSARTKDSDWDKMTKSLCEKKRRRGVREKVCL